VLLAEDRSANSRPLAAAVRELARDPEARVRLQVALSLAAGSLDRSPTSIELLLDIAQLLPDDPWTRLAVVAGLQGQVVDAVREWRARPALAESSGGLDLVHAVAELADKTEVVAVLATVLTDTTTGGEAMAAILGGLAEALERDHEQPPTLPPGTRRRLQALGPAGLNSTTRQVLRLTQALGVERSPRQLALLERAALQATDTSVATEDRLEALAILTFADFANRRHTLFGLLGSQHPEEIQVVALGQLTAEPGVGEELIARWRRLGPRVRQRASAYFLRRPPHHDLLLTALEDGLVTLGEMNLHLERRRALLWSKDADIRRRAEALFDDAGVVTRGEALARMRPALALKGQPSDGRELFGDLCARCHRFGTQGTDVGPDLTEISRKSPETLLHDIVDPNAAVEAEFLSYTIETTDGRLLTGLVRDQTDRGLVLRAGDGTQTVVARAEIEEMRTGGLSLMPEELEAGLEPQDLANLLAFLQHGPPSS
jgi:putative heme-binding domain-containing protein